MKNVNVSSSTADRELLITRTLKAPIALVWKVWTDPDHIKKLVGPTGFTNTIRTMDVKPGGLWEFTMHGPDGTDYKNESVFKEIVKHKKIVFEHRKPDFLATIEFTAEGDTTHISWHMLFETPKEFDMVVKQFKADEGLKQNLVKLENYLVKMDQ